MTTLERDLGLYATLTVSIGAMVGSGIFVLPGLAAKKAGPAVVLAYLLAGLVVVPAALSKAEMATALPEAGGTYLYIDRAMGPLLGTVAGVGAWFSLVFKSAFALVGLGAYLVLFVDVPPNALTAVSLALGVAVVAVNAAGAKLTGRLQAAVVSVVLVVLLGFVADGITYVDGANYHPFFPHGGGGVLAATGFVFVSYAGVTKVASVAEEVEDPGRNIPRAMLGSVVAMMLVYTLVVFVVVGVVPGDAIHESLTPMAAAAGAFGGRGAELAVSVVAVLALASMANAGVLSSSRYPLAMSRDSLAPAAFATVSDRFETPVLSIAFTGAVLLALVAFVPVVDLAKLASAFQILVFVFVNVALVAFREGDVDWYDPAFRTPGYPWVQAAGVLGGLVLLTQMGPVALVGAAGIVAAGVLWFRLYGRERTEREGAAVDEIRARATERAVDAARGAAARETGPVVVAMDAATTPARARSLLRLAAGVASATGDEVQAVRFEAVPDQLSLSAARDRHADDGTFASLVDGLAADFDVDVVAERAVAHDTRRAVVNHAGDVDAGLLLGEWRPDAFGAGMLGADTDWVLEHAPCRVAFLRGDVDADVDEVAVLTRSDRHGASKLRVADAVAAHADATLRLVTALPADASPGLVDATRAFHDELAALCEADTASAVVRGDDTAAALAEGAASADLGVLGVAPRGAVREFLVGNPAVAYADALECPTVLVGADREPPGVLSWFARRLTG
ncbi:MAG: amino acid permease [Halobacterium sp.]